MAYGNNNYNNRGNYGNQRGGSYQNNRGGGNYGNRGGGNYRGGGNNGGGYRGGNRQGGSGGRDHKYVRSSFFQKTIVEDFKAVNGEKPPRVDVVLEPGITEEITIALTAQKANDLIDKILAAVNDPQGDGGIRMTLYCQHKVTQESGEEFDGASILVFGKFPSQNQGGGNRGGYQGGNGRRDYPDRNQNNTGGNYQGGQQDAQRDTSQNGQTNHGSQTQGYQQGGNGQNAQNGAYPSEDEQYQRGGGRSDRNDGSDKGPPHNGGNAYTENPGW